MLDFVCALVLYSVIRTRLFVTRSALRLPPYPAPYVARFTTCGAAVSCNRGPLSVRSCHMREHNMHAAACTRSLGDTE
eukprot:5185476-Prymnesium_polylepis.1